MPFMKPDIQYGTFVDIDTDAGGCLVPADYFDEENPLECTEGTTYYGHETLEGWFCRLSASGYMDRTEWDGPYESEDKAREALGETFDNVCRYCGEYLDDVGECPECDNG